MLIRLKELRKEKGMNMRQTALALGLPYTTYVSYEKGEREPNSEWLINLADYFNCSIDYLLGRSSDRVNDDFLDRLAQIDDDLLKKYGNPYEAREEQKQRDAALTIEQLFADTVTRNEIEHITKYRTLDGYGIKAVESVLDVEFERCNAESEISEPRYIDIKRSVLPVSAGTGAFLEEENMEICRYPDTYESRQADVVIPVEGDSMEPLFHNGDELYVRLQPAVEIGEIGIFFKGEKGYVKRYGEGRLISINPDYEDIYPDNEEQIICKGKVLGKVES